MTLRTILHSVEVAPTGHLFVALKLVSTEGEAVVGSRTHRLGIEPGVDLDAYLASVSEDLAKLSVPFPSELTGLGLDEASHTVSYPGVSIEDVASIKAVAAEAWTPEVLAAVEQRRTEEAAELAAETARKAAEAEAEQKRFNDAVAEAVKAMQK